MMALHQICDQQMPLGYPLKPTLVERLLHSQSAKSGAMYVYRAMTDKTIARERKGSEADGRKESATHAARHG